MRARIAHIRDEEQTSIQTTQLISTVRVVEAATQHLHAIILVRVHQTHMRIRRNQRTRAALLRKIRSRELVTTGQRRTGHLRTTHNLLLLTQTSAVPGLNIHADTTSSQIATALHPRRTIRRILRGSPHVLLQQIRALHLQVIRTVLETEQVTRRHLTRRGRRGTAETLLVPRHHGTAASNTNQVTNRVERHLRVIRTRLNADITVASLIFQSITGHMRDADQRLRELRGKAEAVLALIVNKEATAQTKSKGQIRGRQVHRLAGVLRRRLIGAILPHQLARLQLRSSGTPLLEQGLDFITVGSLQVQRRKIHAVLNLSRNAALMLTVERVGILRGSRGSARRSLRAGIGGATGERAESTQGASTRECRAQRTTARGTRRLSRGRCFRGYVRGVVVGIGRHGKAFRMVCE